MENPYAAPASERPNEAHSVWAAQVPVVAALLVVQGVLECLLGGVLIYRWKHDLSSNVFIAVVLILAAIKIAAGVCNIRHRRRRLGLFALALAPLSVVTIFCAPTALILAVYGLIVYLHPASRRAFIS